MGDPNPHRLSQQDHDQILADITRDYLDGTLEAERPRAIILAGQGGAGKSGIRKQAEAELAADGGSVLIDVDDLRGYHPDYARLQREDDMSAANHVQPDAGDWGDELTDNTLANRRNIIIDGTLKTPHKAVELCKKLKMMGYEVDLRAMAVPEEDSKMGIYARYEGARAKGKPGRWVPEAVHDAAYEGVTRSVDAIETGGHADRVSVYRRGIDAPEKIYDSQSAPSPAAAATMTAERQRPRQTAELEARAEIWNGIVTDITHRGEQGSHFKAAEAHRKRAEKAVIESQAPTPASPRLRQERRHAFA